MTKYPELFSPIKLGAHTIKNRMLMTSMATLYCDQDGAVTDKLVAHYERRARGGVGLINLEFTSVDYPNGTGAVRQIHLANDAAIPGFSALADAVHPYGAKILAQLHHAGDRSVKRPDAELMGPCANEKAGVRAMTKDDIKRLVDRFAAAAKRAQKAGLDGVEIHGGHGYLVSQFLSPLTNKRDDEYGGSVENRARFAMEIIKAIRENCGSSLLLSIRLAAMDWDPKGMPLEDGVKIAKLLDDQGALNLINLTTGVKFGHIGASESQERPDGARVFIAEKIKPEVKTPISIVGKLRTGEMCNDLIKRGVSDMVSIGRQFLCDPEFPNKLREGRDDEVRGCISCMECYGTMANSCQIRCVLNPTLGFDDVVDERNIPKAATKKKVVVVGGGISGMQAAIVAAQRGHEVTLLESRDTLGGQISIACVPPGKSVVANTTKYFSKRLEQENVGVRTGASATVESIAAMGPDAVVLAIGSEPVTPPIQGIENGVQAWDVLSGKVATPKGKRIVVIGGGIVGCETALYLQEAGNQLTILEMLPKISQGQEATHRLRDQKAMDDGGMVVKTKAVVKRVDSSGVAYVDAEAGEVIMPADMVVIATGQNPSKSVDEAQLEAMGIAAVRVGDAVSMGTFRDSTRSGFMKALAL